MPPEGHAYDENEVRSPGVMVASAAIRTLQRFARFPSRAVVGGHDVCQLVKARMLALTYIPSVIRADLHPSLSDVGVAAPPAAHNGDRGGVRWEGSLEPPRLLNGMDVKATRRVRDRSAMIGE